MAKSVQEILNSGRVPMIDKHIDYAELRKQTTILVSAANKRLKRLENAGVVSEAFELNARHGGKFGIKGKSNAEVVAEFARLQNFLKQETSTVKGARKAEKRRRAKKPQAEPKAEWQWFGRDQTFWDVYSRLKDTGELGKKVQPSDVDFVINEIRNAHPNWGVDKIYRAVVNNMRNAEEEAIREEENARQEAGIVNADELFDLGENF